MSIHVAADGMVSFFFMAGSYTIDIWTTASLSIPLLACLHVLTVVNNAAVNVGVHVSV